MGLTKRNIPDPQQWGNSPSARTHCFRLQIQCIWPKQLTRSTYITTAQVSLLRHQLEAPFSAFQNVMIKLMIEQAVAVGRKTLFMLHNFIPDS